MPLTEGHNVPSLSKCITVPFNNQRTLETEWTKWTKIYQSQPSDMTFWTLWNDKTSISWVVCLGRLMAAKNASIDRTGFVWYWKVHSKEGLIFEKSAISLNYLKYQFNDLYHSVLIILLSVYSVYQKRNYLQDIPF